MAVGIKDLKGLADNITLALLAIIWAGIEARLAHVLERKESKLQLQLNALDLVFISICAGALLYFWIQITGDPFCLGEVFPSDDNLLPVFSRCRSCFIRTMVIEGMARSLV